MCFFNFILCLILQFLPCRQLKKLFYDFEDISEGEVSGDCCLICGDTPCRWVHYRSEIVRRVEAVYGDHLSLLPVTTKEEYSWSVVLMRACRNFAFKAMSFMVHGSLGAGNRIKHPDCVEEGVRAAFPPPDGQITGFID